MPLFEFLCEQDDCVLRDMVVEHYLTRWTDADPKCEYCGHQTSRCLSTFNMPFVGVMTARYNDKKKAGAHREGMWAVRRKTLSGKPENVFLETFQDRREFCKAEGLIPAEDVGPIDADPDGKHQISQTRTRTGRPGTWM